MSDNASSRPSTSSDRPHPPDGREPSAGGDRRSVVLIVEDNREILRAIQRTLALQKYGILTAMDGEEALSVARTHKPDLILLDVMIPKVDGLEVLTRLKGDPSTRGIMVILVTGRSSLDHRVQGLEAGADDYIPKPFHIPELLARVRSALRVKRLSDDLRERNRQLVDSQRTALLSKKMATIGLLASGIAHEFNNIMAGISGYAQLAKKDPKYRDALADVAISQTERALELTRSLSTYNRGTSDDVECDVVETIESAFCLLAKELDHTEIRVTKEILERPRVDMSPASLEELALHLLLNAVQAIEDGKGCIAVKVGPAAATDSFAIEISDTGVGIHEENLDRIFDPFFTTRCAPGGGIRSGTGLGLTVCYNIVNTHGGAIEVSSAPGRGTTFQVTLPRARESSPTAPRPTPATPAQPRPDVEHPGRPLRILVVDDEEPTRDVIREYLRDQEVVACAGVDEALQSHAVRPFDYVILDVAIEGSMDGMQAFERFSLFEPPPRIIFASGRFPDATYRAYIRRAHGHILKPFKFEELLRLLGLPDPSLPDAAGGRPPLASLPQEGASPVETSAERGG